MMLVTPLLYKDTYFWIRIWMANCQAKCNTFEK